jgi:hypothetical protein
VAIDPRSHPLGETSMHPFVSYLAARDVLERQSQTAEAERHAVARRPDARPPAAIAHRAPSIERVSLWMRRLLRSGSGA